MKTLNKQTRVRCTKWGAAFVTGVLADLLLLFGGLGLPWTFLIHAGMIPVNILCFDAYKKKDINLLKLAYIVFSALIGAYHGLEWVFLCIFERMTNRSEEDAASNEKQKADF